MASFPHHPGLRPLETSWRAHARQVNDLVVLPDGDTCVSASEDGDVLAWSLRAEQVLVELSGHTGPVNSLALSPDGHGLLSAGDDGDVRVWSTSTWRTHVILEGHSGYVRQVAATDRLAEDDTVRVWDLDSGRCVRVLEGHDDDVVAVAVDPAGRRAVSASLDNCLVVWDLERGELERVLYEAGGEIMRVAGTRTYLPMGGSRGRHHVAPGRLLVGAAGDTLLSAAGEVITWDLGTGAELARWAEQGWHIDAMAMHPDGDQLAVGTSAALSLWNGPAAGREPGGAAVLCTGDVCALAYSPDGKLLVSGAGDGTIGVWCSRSDP